MESAFGVEHGEVAKAAVPNLRQVVSALKPMPRRANTRVARTQMGRNFQMKRLNRKLGPS